LSTEKVKKLSFGDKKINNFVYPVDFINLLVYNLTIPAALAGQGLPSLLPPLA
jgi:hypothetical protein